MNKYLVAYAITAENIAAIILNLAPQTAGGRLSSCKNMPTGHFVSEQPNRHLWSSKNARVSQRGRFYARGFG